MNSDLIYDLVKLVLGGVVGYWLKTQMEKSAARRGLVQSALIDLHQLVTSAEYLWPHYGPIAKPLRGPLDLIDEPSGCIWAPPFVPVEQYLRVSDDMRLQRHLMLFMDNWRAVETLSRALGEAHLRLTSVNTWDSNPARRDLHDYQEYRAEILRALTVCLRSGSEACAHLLESNHGWLFEQNHREKVEGFMEDVYKLSIHQLRARANWYAGEPTTAWVRTSVPAVPMSHDAARK